MGVRETERESVCVLFVNQKSANYVFLFFVLRGFAIIFSSIFAKKKYVTPFLSSFLEFFLYFVHFPIIYCELICCVGCDLKSWVVPLEGNIVHCVVVQVCR